VDGHRYNWPTAVRLPR
jgi:hypothetical protein